MHGHACRCAGTCKPEKAGTSASKEPSKFMLLNFALFAFNFALLFTLASTKICSIKIFGAKIYIIAEIAEIDSLLSEG